MDNKLAFAAALRAVRGIKGLSQEMVARSTSRPYIGRLENGESTPSLDKLQALSEALDVSPLTLLALTMTLQEDQPLSAITARLKQELAGFEKAGGIELLREQIIDGDLVLRNKGLPVNPENLAKVQSHKAAGFSQKQTAERLGLSTSTVHDLWKRGD